MRRIGDEDTKRETCPARGHKIALGRERIFAQRSVRSGAASPILATKGARAHTENAQKDHKGRDFSPYVALSIFR